jgi:hypothetical protein
MISVRGSRIRSIARAAWAVSTSPQTAGMISKRPSALCRKGTSTSTECSHVSAVSRAGGRREDWIHHSGRWTLQRGSRANGLSVARKRAFFETGTSPSGVR